MSRLHQVIVNAVVLVVPGVIITYGLTEHRWWTLVAGSVCLVLGAILVHVNDKRSANRLALARLYSKLHIPKDADLQCYVYTPGWVLRFILGEDARFPDKGQPRSKMLIYQGVVGRCFRTKKIVKVLPNKSGFEDRLVGEFGFPRKDASRFQTDRAAILCLPILNARGRVAGVLSLDAKEDVFTPEVMKQIDAELAVFFEALEVY